MDDDALPSQGWITLDLHGDLRIVSFHGEHDLSTLAAARERLSDARIGGAGPIIVDLSAVTFMDSGIVSALFHAYRVDMPPRVRFVMPSDTAPRRLFAFIGLDKVLPVFESVDDALTHAGEGDHADS
jgi:anti-anti-sigma factor